MGEEGGCGRGVTDRSALRRRRSLAPTSHAGWRPPSLAADVDLLPAPGTHTLSHTYRATSTLSMSAKDVSCRTSRCRRGFRIAKSPEGADPCCSPAGRRRTTCFLSPSPPPPLLAPSRLSSTVSAV
jgi:hypothetical protein